MSTPPRYDPAELEAEGLTAEEAEDLRQGLAEVDRGETVPLAQVRARMAALLDARARARRTG